MTPICKTTGELLLQSTPAFSKSTIDKAVKVRRGGKGFPWAGVEGGCSNGCLYICIYLIYLGRALLPFFVRLFSRRNIP